MSEIVSWLTVVRRAIAYIGFSDWNRKPYTGLPD